MKATITKPYNDKNLVFNQETSRYELTIECVKANLGMTFKDDGVLQKRITKNSRKVYNYLMYRSYSSNNQVVLFFLNKTEEGRKFLIDILLEQMDADSMSGYNDISNTIAINLSNGQNIGKGAIRENFVCDGAEMVCDNCEQYFGFNLFVATLFPSYLFAFMRQNDIN